MSYPRAVFPINFCRSCIFTAPKAPHEQYMEPMHRFDILQDFSIFNYDNTLIFFV